MNQVQRVAFNKEISLAKEFIAQGELDTGFTHLERAHVIGQAFVFPHTLTHWLMLKLAWQRRQPAAAFGQLIRIFLGALGSAIGSVPVGNTGGTDISMFKRLPIAPELQRIIDGEVPPDVQA